MPWLRWLDASATIRLGFAVLTAFLAVQQKSVIDVLPWLLLVVAIDLVIVVLDSMPIARRGVSRASSRRCWRSPPRPQGRPTPW